MFAGRRGTGAPTGGKDSSGRLAVQAFLTFGRGRHEAGLNFGDCPAYASAAAAGDALLFVGQDFAGTDIRRA